MSARECRELLSDVVPMLQLGFLKHDYRLQHSSSWNMGRIRDPIPIDFELGHLIYSHPRR